MFRTNLYRLIAALALGSAVRLEAQAPTAQVQISVAAARYVRATLARTCVIAINAEQYQTSEEFVMGHGAPLHADQTVEALRQLPDLRVARKNDVVQCEPASGSCRMVGADAFVSISAPIIHEDKSIVNVIYQHRSGGESTALVQEQYRLEIQRGASGWDVLRRVPITR
ncbi:MAG: hypothetical protein ACO1Q7_12550 [Gemmatimonas sp.]